MNDAQMIRARENAYVLASHLSMLIAYCRPGVTARDASVQLSTEYAVDALEASAKAMGYRLVPVALPSLVRGADLSVTPQIAAE